MGEAQQQEVVIVGGGIAGLATAIALLRVGVKSLVLERHHELRTSGAAITLAPNAWRALDVLGVAHKLTPIYQAFRKGLVTNIENGSIQEINFNRANSSTKNNNEPKDRGLVTNIENGSIQEINFNRANSSTKNNNEPKDSGMGIRSVHRKALLQALVEELPQGTVRFSSKLVSIKTEVLQDSSTIQILELEDGAVIKTKVLIGCDGVHSVVAQWLGLSTPIDSGRSCIRGLAVLPDGHGLKNDIRQYLASGKRAGIVPLNEKEVFWFMSVDFAAQHSDPKLIQREVLQKLAKDFPSDYLNVVHHADLDTLTWAPLMFRRPWDLILGNTHKGCVVVAGDAMHPMTPDLGQGGCTALEDAVVLGRCIGRARQKKIEEGIEEYVDERKWRVAGLIVGAYLSGWIQQGGTGIRGWAVRWFRDHIFYRFAFHVIANAVNYDCGDLPIVKGE